MRSYHHIPNGYTISLGYRCYMIISKSEMDMINNTSALDKAINEEKYEKG